MQRSLPVHLENREYDGQRQYSPTAARNAGPICDVLSQHLPRDAHILEIASGTGEHGYHMCQVRSDITWQPSDPNPEARASQKSWAQNCNGRMRAPRVLDITKPHLFADLPHYEALFCSNMIHITPWATTLSLAACASVLIKPKGMVFIYGPFKEGAATAPSNLEFDKTLRSRDPQWGVRDLSSVKYIFAKLGFNHFMRIAMPKNNLILVFQRSAS